ncbi:hypothetical protein JTE90_000844 [Oedothorax gibbosus]|uniref:Uncharacterized protein n=1 Tax=Oedothorax gibbosus TaxID=931172 RepID=A0AAV6VWA7_9ARAC|nr:hypothetical protein JTE90_000844 [Oedothorax gibbosus]
MKISSGADNSKKCERSVALSVQASDIYTACKGFPENKQDSSKRLRTRQRHIKGSRRGTAQKKERAKEGGWPATRFSFDVVPPASSSLDVPIRQDQVPFKN